MQKTLKIISGINYWSIIVLPFSVMIGPGLANSIIGLILFTFLVEKLLKKEKLLVMSLPVKVFFIFIIFGALSFFNSINLKDSLNGMVKLFKYLVIFVIYSQNVKDKLHLKRIAIFLACAISLIGIDALWQIYSGKDFIRGNVLQDAIGLPRATASFPGCNALGIYLTGLTPLIAGLAIFLAERKEKLLFTIAAILGAVGIYLTLSRGAGVGFFVSLVFLSLVKKNKIIILTLALLVLTYFFIMPKNIKDWAKSVHYNPIILMTCDTRVGIYRNTLHMIAEHPFLGVGINTFSRSYSQYRTAQVEATNPTADGYYAHNNFLHMAGEMGLFGLATFLFFLFLVFQAAWKAFKKNKDPYLKAFAISVFAAIMAYLINGLTETSLYHPRLVMIFWLMVGLALSFALKGKEE